jgi:hypothetical protein
MWPFKSKSKLKPANAAPVQVKPGFIRSAWRAELSPGELHVYPSGLKVVVLWGDTFPVVKQISDLEYQIPPANRRSIMGVEFPNRTFYVAE